MFTFPRTIAIPFFVFFCLLFTQHASHSEHQEIRSISFCFSFLCEEDYREEPSETMTGNVGTRRIPLRVWASSAVAAVKITQRSGIIEIVAMRVIHIIVIINFYPFTSRQFCM